MQSKTDVLIIGGGVIGCSIAYTLRKLGVAVTVVDTGEIGAEASSAAAGLLAPLGSLSGPGPLADLLLASWSMFPALVPELEVQWLTGDEARWCEPLLAPDITAAIFAPEESQISAPQVVKAFARAAVNLGAELYPHHQVIGAVSHTNNITKIRLSQ